MDGEYLTDAEYAVLYGLGPNIQDAFDALDKALGDAREVIKERIEKSSATV